MRIIKLIKMVIENVEWVTKGQLWVEIDNDPWSVVSQQLNLYLTGDFEICEMIYDEVLNYEIN